MWLIRGSRGARPRRPAGGGWPGAVLFDRDGTLVHDVPYNGDPDLVVPVPGARWAVDALRAEGVALGVVTNQSGVGRGLLDRRAVLAVADRIERLLGPFDVWAVCPHAPADGCRCRKPAPGLVEGAAAELGVDPARAVVVGDRASDVEAAEAAGATGLLVRPGGPDLRAVVAGLVGRR
jgi:histidinol-phosphate phosphatase family protein